MKNSILAAAAALCLAACGSQPNDEDVRAALRSQMEGIGGKAGAGMFDEELKKVKVIGCNKADAGGYRCDFQGFMGAQSARFVKADSGWVMVMGQ